MHNKLHSTSQQRAKALTYLKQRKQDHKIKLNDTTAKESSMKRYPTTANARRALRRLNGWHKPKLNNKASEYRRKAFAENPICLSLD